MKQKLQIFLTAFCILAIAIHMEFIVSAMGGPGQLSPKQTQQYQAAQREEAKLQEEQKQKQQQDKEQTQKAWNALENSVRQKEKEKKQQQPPPSNNNSNNNNNNNNNNQQQTSSDLRDRLAMYQNGFNDGKNQAKQQQGIVNTTTGKDSQTANNGNQTPETTGRKTGAAKTPELVTNTQPNINTDPPRGQLGNIDGTRRPDRTFRNNNFTNNFYNPTFNIFNQNAGAANQDQATNANQPQRQSVFSRLFARNTGTETNAGVDARRGTWQGNGTNAGIGTRQGNAINTGIGRNTGVRFQPFQNLRNFWGGRGQGFFGNR
jgi:hypothetical protein